MMGTRAAVVSSRLAPAARRFMCRVATQSRIGALSRPALRPSAVIRAQPLSTSSNAASRSSSSSTAAAAASAVDVSSTPDIDWDSLSFGIEHCAPFMYRARWSSADQGYQGAVVPYAPLQLDPSAQVLNYGQSVFEGMKAQRSAKDRIVLFRPDRNAARCAAGAARLSMPSVPEDQFVRAVTETVRANAAWVPPRGKGSLYLRPLLMGTGPILGLGPAPYYDFVVFGAAVGAYFKGGQLSPIDLVVEEQFHRAAPRGMGGTKAAGNYSPVLVTQLAAKKAGFADVVYLDAKHDRYLEEVSSCNIFVVRGKRISTPPLSGSILPGVTRASVIELARSRGYDVREEAVAVEEAMEQADEVFTTGTAVVVSPVGSLTFRGERRQYGDRGRPTPVALELYEALTGLQQEALPDPYGWVVPVA